MCKEWACKIHEDALGGKGVNQKSITNTFLKTVSAFSNYDGGVILFGIDDDGNI
mgnify:CR=1 FL=1